MEIDLYIAAMGRSGSTALANMATILPAQQVLIEPTAAAFGYSKWDLISSQGDCLRFLSLCKNLRRPNALFGIKEVHPRAHAIVGSGLVAKVLIVLVRNIADVYLSLREKHQRQEANGLYDQQWVCRYIEGSSAALVDITLSNPDALVLRYESFFFSKSEQLDLTKRIGWQLDGDPFTSFDIYDRMYEVERSLSRHTPRLEAVSRRLDVSDGLFANKLAERHAEYQKLFNYS